ncbi:MAG: amidohydrolase, partial [Emcibacter sp.]|nr:amidohydrolase [Emcibacter sp.]
MKKSILLLLTSGIFFASATAKACDEADLLLMNGNVYTGLDDKALSTTIAVKGGKIIYIGSAKGYECGSHKQIDLKGAFVYPGFTDAHAHLKGVGYREKVLNLQGINSLSDTMKKVREYVTHTKAGEWVVGRGWIEKVWPEKRFPTRHDLDTFVNDRPVVLSRADGHALLMNTYAMKLAGIDRDTPDPDGGAIRKDENGEPTGILVDNAMDLVRKMIPAHSAKDDKHALELALKRNVSVGWTQTQNAGGTYNDIGLLKELKAEGKLLHRLYYAMDSGAEAEKILTQGIETDPMLTLRAIKLYSDGALGSRGAALIDKYSDYDTKGLMLTSKEKALPVMIRALMQGVQIETHAIGDKANKLVLDWYEMAFKVVPEQDRKVKNPRWRIEHAQNIQPEDQIRFKELDIIPSMQPSHAIGDLHFAGDRLGKKRLGNAYVWANMIKLGLMVPAGSDAPVETGDPRIEFYAAIARKDLDGYSAEGWHLEQTVSRIQALKMLTIWPAYAAFQENERGTIEVGKYADFTILSKDIMVIPVDKIMSSKVV